MQLNDAKLKSILTRENYVATADLVKAEAFVKSRRGSMTEYLLTAGLITEELLGQAIAESLGVPFADLNARPPQHDQVMKIPSDIAAKYRVVLANTSAKGVTVATDDPTRSELKAALQKLFKGKTLHIAYATSNALDIALTLYRKPLETRTRRIIATGERVAPEIIETIIDDAIAFRASDIHFEPEEDAVLIRLRIDGRLQDAGTLPKDQYGNILNRIKVQASLRIDEHQAAQDGALRYQNGEQLVDLRVSVVPTLDGEKVVMRVLSEYVRSFTLNNLGLDDAHQALITTAAHKPFGMILVTGPTGSGKTTTLYSLMKILNQPEINITTIEDPVEYKVASINQIQVNQQTNLTFAAGLKSIIRQDPDVILVGEVRDGETAEIAVNAALTGQLMLSTFHANDAATAIPRLLEMGIEPFLLASTLELIIAQRLVRRLCLNCRYSQTVKRSTLKAKLPAIDSFFKEESITLYKGKGCANCNGSGFKGRVAIFEFLVGTPKLRELMMKSASSQMIAKLSRSEGQISMFEDGIAKVKAGVTTLDELLRVAKPPEA